MNVIEPASSGRSKGRGCKQNIAKGDLPFGEQLPNPFADGDMTLWFHLLCAAYRRPEPLHDLLSESPPEDGECSENLTELCRIGIEAPRLQRIAEAELAPSGRTRCRHRKEAIEKATWRLRLEYFEEGAFNPSGNIHLGCSTVFLTTTDTVMARVIHFTTELTDTQAKEIKEALQ
ncbi:MAG: hypothetical protein CMQ05_15880 [Gammaproteobacteria bacterium]|uniref:PARP-type domain-containing protein n=1 Tax=OM182 bacterium MED-G24 TaxID=1986255 RepID=A0A2A5WY57_9GAMM|nr:hypothetical protein [Gammaproteobacteria bacterium]PDH41500.1 MAG: hypothetical protein CNE99_01815 [OM182 bacterium MED-G24]RPG25897.1 MAG: hypothetical protein CBC10_005820 [Gammaproteobacteria bacterium TMED50]|tara:strand:+ start:267 stop:791 length:525 start_codon:yes stop_codon:yes gene_type:complete